MAIPRLLRTHECAPGIIDDCYEYCAGLADCRNCTICAEHEFGVDDFGVALAFSRIQVLENDLSRSRVEI